MPTRRSAWSAWNFLAEAMDGQQDKDGVTLTYWMNRLQSLSEKKYGPIFVTLNAPTNMASPEKVVGQFAYEHPVYTANSVASQKTLTTLQGWKGVRFAGAWTNYGFHEDGFTSGLRAATEMGAVIPFDIQSAERDLPPSSQISRLLLSGVEFLRNRVTPYLAILLAPIFIAFTLLLETIVNAVFYITAGQGKRSAFRNDLRTVRASWERQLPGEWMVRLQEVQGKKNR
jgi:hypothetical protein